jgi:outer membrane protein TolC
LPRISLTANGGAASSELRDLLDFDRLAWTIAANLSQPIFQGGRLKADIEFSEAIKSQALARWAQAALNAFWEVESFLAAEVYLKDQESAVQLASSESILAEELAWQQYQRGLADIITVLESQRRSFNARSSLLQITNDRLQNRINLYLALGGDFLSETPDSTSTLLSQQSQHP